MTIFSRNRHILIFVTKVCYKLQLTFSTFWFDRLLKLLYRKTTLSPNKVNLWAQRTY